MVVTTFKENQCLCKRNRLKNLDWVEIHPRSGRSIQSTRPLPLRPGWSSRIIRESEKRVVLCWRLKWKIWHPPKHLRFAVQSKWALVPSVLEGTEVKIARRRFCHKSCRRVLVTLTKCIPCTYQSILSLVDEVVGNYKVYFLQKASVKNRGEIKMM